MKKVQVKDVEFSEGIPKICVPLIGRTEQAILDEISCLNTEDYDLVELRIDYYEYVENLEKVENLLNKIRESLGKPILFTYRTKKEGGVHDMPEEKYFALNHSIVESGLVDIVDVELFSSETEIKKLVSYAKEKNVKVIMSNHDFFKTPSKDEIINRLLMMQEYGADITKIAVMPKCEEDVLTLLGATLEMKKGSDNCPCVTMSMGAIGALSRVSGELFGSCMTFAAAGHVSAPGQISIKDTKYILNLLHSK